MTLLPRASGVGCATEAAATAGRRKYIMPAWRTCARTAPAPQPAWRAVQVAPCYTISKYQPHPRQRPVAVPRKLKRRTCAAAVHMRKGI